MSNVTIKYMGQKLEGCQETPYTLSKVVYSFLILWLRVAILRNGVMVSNLMFKVKEDSNLDDEKDGRVRHLRTKPLQ